MLSIGTPELVVILVVALVVVGPKRFPELLRDIAHIYRDFMSAIDEAKKGLEDEVDVKEDLKKQWEQLIEEDENQEKQKKF